MRVEFGLLLLICSLASFRAAPINETTLREEPLLTSTESPEVVIRTQNITATVTETTDEVIIDPGQPIFNDTEPAHRAGTDRLEDYEASFDTPVLEVVENNLHLKEMNSSVPEIQKEPSTTNILNDEVSTLEDKRPTGDLPADKATSVVDPTANLTNEATTTLDTPVNDPGFVAITRDSFGKVQTVMKSPPDSQNVNSSNARDAKRPDADGKPSGSPGLVVSLLCVVMLLVL